MYNLIWSREKLTAQKLGKFSEYYAKMELTSYGMSIYTSEVDDHGIDFVAETQRGFLKFQVKSVRKADYVYMQKKNFDVSDDSLFLYLLVLTDNEHPKSYIIPASAWKEGTDSKSGLFADYKNFERPEYGLHLAKKYREELEAYSIENTLEKLN